MITLPSRPRRAWLMGFWLAISVCSGLLIGLLLALLIAPQWFGLGGILMLVLACTGLLRRQAIRRAYAVWNRLAHYFSRTVQLLLMGICFYIIFVAVGRTGSTLRLAHPPPTTSLWAPRGTLASSAYVSQYGARDGASLQKGWIATFLSWAVRSGNLWALSLLPFFILLSALQIDQEKNTFPASIYTLF
jgi:hypothetical protein